MIPHTVHYCWFGLGKKSELTDKCRESWRKFLPGFDIKEWNEDVFDIEGAPAYVKEAYAEKKYAFVSDYVRLTALYEEGGIYFDTDLEAIRDMTPLFGAPGFIGAESRHTLCTAVIASEAGAEWLKSLIEAYGGMAFRREDGSLDLTPNSRRMLEYFSSRYGYSPSDDVFTAPDGFKIYPADYFSPVNCFTGKKTMTENTYTVHHFDASWKSGGQKFKNRLLMLLTRIIGEDNREKLTAKLKKR